MLAYKQEFIRFMVENGVLLFGDFTLKSGRRAPYFINSGKYRTGKQIAKLGEYYAACYLDSGIAQKKLLGPAYKGIPLVVSTAIALAAKGVDVSYCFDRKEAKDHGEGGLFVGEQIKDGDTLCIVEDVMTSGKALREILPKVQEEAEAEVLSMIIAVDRQERGLDSDMSAVQVAYEYFGVEVHAIVTADDIITAIDEGIIPGREHLAAMREYRRTYGA